MNAGERVREGGLRNLVGCIAPLTPSLSPEAMLPLYSLPQFGGEGARILWDSEPQRTISIRRVRSLRFQCAIRQVQSSALQKKLTC